MNKTKIVATIGPASYAKTTLTQLIKSGVNVCRLNFSHGTHEEYEEVIKIVRALNDRHNNHTAILADLQGPKLRVGAVENDDIELVTGKELIITSDKAVGNDTKLSINYSDLARDVKKGDTIKIDDGKIVLEVLRTDNKKNIKAKVIQGGPLSSNKGFNLPNTNISLPSVTKKDLKDLDFALKHELEWIALSFVRTAAGIKQVKKIIEKRKSNAKVIAKIEKPQAIENIDTIIEAADGVMVARGDLGVEIPMQSVPLIQKRIVNKARRASKPVIIATQLMESMMTSLTPSRADVNDVANSVMDGADAVMLSAETSLGEYPVEVIKAMHKIVKEAESFEDIYHQYAYPDPKDERFISDSICFNANTLARRVNAKAIVTMSFSGYTGRKISSYRPSANTFVFTANRSILNMLSLIWGVRGFYYTKFTGTDETIADIMKQLKKENLVKPGDLIINITSMPIGQKGKSNMLKLSEVD